MQMSFSVAEIGGTKRKILIFYVIFFNTDISITTQDIAMIFFNDNSSYQLLGKCVSDF